MNITIFGANGGIGKFVTKLAIDKGHNVTAVLRPNSKMIEKMRMDVIYAELHQQDQINKAIENADVIINAIGPSLDMSRKLKGTPIADGLQNLISAMNKQNRKRLIIIGTPTLTSKEDKNHITTILPKVMAKILYPNAYREMKKMEKIIYVSNIDWTVVRFINPNLKTNGNGYDYVFGDKNGKLSISRYNIANFIVEESMQDKFIKRMPIVFNK
ncbi:TPA_asm: oxidoreductase [Listeria monocytogenes]|uniref:NAD(P)H-binding protein n=1 Tax=Listeria monocytogenes TaxID=1639 RepID=UPI000737BC74|nr:NAD(P)H-binding protein [Listeria monocytogenes]EAC6233256.1 NAD-dependent epimerase/dehydratase family protein [Listeria monocytogenes]EAC9156225.1 NAD-dependent epimerase/dehydratase family protein [Listeria monocytogenes]MCE3189809.1 NAD(P)H-binding protein [Listeria monocytogenes]WBE39981.1 NAD(P)H-binding protein [Listeria monocytogenes]HAB0135614.1 oxidoreductase [Listeria monocytogenes]